MANSPIQVRLGPPTVSTPGMGGQVGYHSLNEYIADLEKRQKEKLIEILGSENALEKLYAGTDREYVPKAIEEVVENKVAYIKGLLSKAQEFESHKVTYSGLSGTITNSRSMWFKTQKFVEAWQLGLFIEKGIVFKGSEGASAGTTAPAPDIKLIQTELKTGIVGAKKGTSGRIKGGDIMVEMERLGIREAGWDKSTEEKKAYDTMVKASYQENIALLELYIKMKNLLIMETEPDYRFFSSGRKSSAIGFHFVAIVLFVEILIKKIREWIKERDELNAGAYVRMGFETPDPTKLITPMGKDKPGGSIMATGNKVTYRVTYKSYLENLFQGEPGDKKELETLLKKVEDLYMVRRNIFQDLSGKGKGKAAAEFFGTIKNREMPGFNNLNIEY